MKSVHTASLSEPERQEIGKRLARARNMIMNGQPAAAIPELKELTRRDPDYAKAWFFLGRAELLAGRTAEAIPHLETAVARADFFQETPPAWSQALRALALELQVPLIDTEAALRQASALGVPGFDLFLDGCHPSLKGDYVIAQTIVRGLARQGDLPGELVAGPGLTEEETIARTKVSRDALGFFLFNQAVTLAFLYPPPEYQAQAISLFDQAAALASDPTTALVYQGYVNVLLERPGPAALSFSRARKKKPDEFAAVLRTKLGTVVILQDPGLWVKKADADGLASLYPTGSGKSAGPGPDPASCQYRFQWDGNEYRPASR
jgi:hypothetical protein